MFERFKPAEAQPLEENNQNNREEFPEFNPQRAQELQDTARAEQAANNQAENIKNPEEEWKETNPEELKDPAKLIKQLEKMGIDQRILDNPAVQREITDKLRYFGIGPADQITGGESSRQWTTRPGETLSDDVFAIYGSSSAENRIDPQQHDEAVMRLIKNQNNSLTIECAYADRDRTEFKNIFRNYSGPTNNKNYVKCFEDTNIISVMDFALTDDGKYINTYEWNSYENSTYPETNRNAREETFNISGVDETERCFNAEGVEMHRIDRRYDSKSYIGRNGLIAHIGTNSNTGGPNNASFNFFRRLSNLKGDVVEAISYDRNPDNTIYVSDYDARKGETLEIENCPMNTEHGTDELVPENQSIARAWAEKESQGQ